jgi:hypothetical protein
MATGGRATRYSQLFRVRSRCLSGSSIWSPDSAVLTPVA